MFLSLAFFALFCLSIYPLLMERGSGAEGQHCPAVLSNLASRRDQRLATFHPKCPLSLSLPPSLPPSSIYPSLYFFLSLSPILPSLGLTLHSSCTNTIPSFLSLSLFFSLSLPPLHSYHTYTTPSPFPTSLITRLA